MTRYVLTAAVIAASALVTLAILPHQRPAQNTSISAAVTDRIDAGHTLVQDSVEMTLEARRSAARAADAELAASRHAVSDVTERSAPPKRTKPMHIAAAPPSVEPLPAPAPTQLRPPALQPVAQPAPKKPLMARVVGTVERIPGWVGSGVVNAATWVVELPGQVVTRLPERRLL